MEARFAATLSERESIRSDTRVVAGRRWKSPGGMRRDHFQESFRPANLVASCRDWPGQQPGVEFCPFRARLGCENDLRKTAQCRTTFGARHAFARRGNLLRMLGIAWRASMGVNGQSRRPRAAAGEEIASAHAATGVRTNSENASGLRKRRPLFFLQR